MYHVHSSLLSPTNQHGYCWWPGAYLAPGHRNRHDGIGFWANTNERHLGLLLILNEIPACVKSQFRYIDVTIYEMPIDQRRSATQIHFITVDSLRVYTSFYGSQLSFKRFVYDVDARIIYNLHYVISYTGLEYMTNRTESCRNHGEIRYHNLIWLSSNFLSRQGDIIWAQRRLDSHAPRLFVQKFNDANNKYTTKALH